MKNTTKNKLKMYKAVQAICAENQSSWTNLPVFENYLTAFSDKLGLMESYVMEQANAILGVSTNKNNERIAASELALVFVNALAAFATSINDVQLLQQVKISAWDIRKGNSVNALAFLDRIIGAATVHINELDDFGITPLQLQELTDKRDLLANLFTAPRKAILDRKQITASIHSLTKEIDNLLKFSLDKLAGVLKPSQPDFFLRYTNARSIVDYKGKSNHNDPEQDDGFDFSG